jgi:hypothetical protein
MEDKARLLRDLLALGVCYRSRLSEQDLGIYAEMIDPRLNDREWAAAVGYYSGDFGDPEEPQRFMPTPQELIAVGRALGREKAPPPEPTAEDVEFRRLYWEQRRRQRLAAQERRRAELVAHADEMLHVGECPNADSK